MSLVPPSTPRLLLVFLRMRWLKLVNRVSVNSSFLKRAASKGAEKKRTGTRSRFLPSLTLSLSFLVLMAYTSFGFHRAQLRLMMSEFALAQDFFKIFSIYLSVILTSALFLTLGTSDFKKTEWDLEWLVTLPLSMRLLMAIRVLERTVSNPILILALLPPVILYGMVLGQSMFAAVTLGILFTLPVLILTATLQTILDTGVRLHWRPARIKNLQAVTNLTGAALFYVISLSSAQVSRPLVFLKEQLSPVFLYGPLGLLVTGLYSAQRQFQSISFYWIEITFLISFAFLILLRLLREGVVTGSGQTSVRKSMRKTGGQSRAAFYSFPYLSAFSLRELRMLWRDQQYLAQTVVTPLLILFLQVYFLYQSKGILFTNARTAAAVAFAMAGYSMMSSCYLCVVTEGPALWIFYTLPRTMRSLMIEKVARWGYFAAIYVLFFFAWCAHQPGRVIDLDLTWPFIFALLGIPILVVVACSLGILGYEGPSATPQRRMKPGSTYTYLIVLAAFVACIFIPQPAYEVVALLMMSLVAVAFWQKASARLPFLLDPASQPLAKVGLADGLIAAQVFYLLLLFFTFVQVNRPAPLSGLIQFRSVLFAGLICWAMLRYQFRQTVLQNWPVIASSRSKKRGSGNPWILTAAVALGFFLFDFLYFRSHWGRAITLLTAPQDMLRPSDLKSLSLFLFIPVASFFEETLFRGIIYRGLRMKFRIPVCIALSATLSVLMHPFSQWVPSALLGIACSLLFELSGSLGAPVFLHALAILIESLFLSHF